MDEKQQDPTFVARAFGAAPRREADFHGTSVQSLYVPASDGVRLALEVILPKDLPQGMKIPALLVQTRYWREIQLRRPWRWAISPSALIPKEQNSKRFFAEHGYAVVVADVRGTGASFGRYSRPWSPESVHDAGEIVEWILQQPWSNGRIGAFGVSYGGSTAELLAALRHPAVKIVIPKFNHPDAFPDISHPGGVFNHKFIKAWGLYDFELDQNRMPTINGGKNLILKGVKPVDEDRNGDLLKQAVQEHAANFQVYDTARDMAFRDQRVNGLDFSMDDISVVRLRKEVSQSTTLVVGWGSWMDAGTADAVIRRFLTLPNAPLAVIGAWDHGGFHNASPFQQPDALPNPSLEQQYFEMLSLFDACLQEDRKVEYRPKSLLYYTMGEETWKSTTTWPPEGFNTERWFLSARGSLKREPQQVSPSCSEYCVDFTATTGDSNRWWEMGVLQKKSVVYPDLADQQSRSLCFTSAPLPADLEISGYPTVSLWITSTYPDGNILVYLENIEQDGKAVYLTEGQLRLIHRRLARPTADNLSTLPHHTYRESDACPLLPGEPAELSFTLHPTSVLVRKGTCLRLRVAGHDAGTFLRVPEHEQPVVQVWHDFSKPSSIDLPMKWRGGDQ